MGTNQEKRRVIKIKDSTYKGIKKLGLFGETFDDVLQRMMRIDQDKEKIIKKSYKTNIIDKV